MSCLHCVAGEKATQKDVESKWLNSVQHGYGTAANTHSDTQGGSTGPGPESDVYDQLVPSAKLSAVGALSFTVTGPTSWNSLSDNVISAWSLSTSVGVS